MTHTILRIDASARHNGSVTRDLTNRIVDHLNPGNVIRRDLSDPLPHIDENWVEANFTPVDQRSDDHRATLKLSDALISELRAADTVVIGLPIYNFGVPAAFKAWVDQVARVDETFNYTDTGPVGLLEGKSAVVAIATGGVKVGSDWDYASDYVRHVLGFIGITDVSFVSAEGGAQDTDALASAYASVDQLPLAA